MRRIPPRYTTSLDLAMAFLLIATAVALPAVQVAHAQPLHTRIAGIPGYVDGTSIAFMHKADASNSFYDYTVLDNPHTNNQPNTILMVTQFWDYPQGSAGVFNNHNIGVWYNGSRWTIFNQDGAAIPVGASFAVVVQSASNGVFVANATNANVAGDYTLLSNPLLNNNPNALILVTPVYGATALYNNHPIGVWYTGSQWAIFNEDWTAMQPGEIFNVMVTMPLGTQCYQQLSTASNTAGDRTTLGDGFSNNGLTWETHNWGTTGPYVNHPTGVYIYGSPWGSANAHAAIFNEDIANMLLGVTFNYCVLTQ